MFSHVCWAHACVEGNVNTGYCRLVSTFSVLGPVSPDDKPLGHSLSAAGSFSAKYCSLARLNG